MYPKETMKDRYSIGRFCRPRDQRCLLIKLIWYRGTIWPYALVRRPHIKEWMVNKTVPLRVPVTLEGLRETFEFDMIRELSVEEMAMREFEVAN